MAHWVGGWVRGICVSVLLLLAAPRLAHAEPPSADNAPKIGFSNLLFRVDEKGIFGFAGGDSRVFILELLRKLGYRAVGAENLVFDKDEARTADYVLGGTVQSLECLEVRGFPNCRIGVEWQLLDVERDEVVYRTVTRAAVYRIYPSQLKAVGKQMIEMALRSLASRQSFRGALKPSEVGAIDEPSTPAAFKACTTEALPMPQSFEQVARATVIVRNGDGFGSGFVLSSDGLILTAAHVVTSAQLEVKLRDGSVLSAKPIRISRSSDVALLVAQRSGGSALPCFALNLDAKLPGTEVYAIGAPASQELAFSITRGIVSGERVVHGTPLLQTDASVSPGNSGGPLVDAQGRAAAIISRKLAGVAVEGIAFGIPVEVALAALKLRGALESDPALLAAAPAALSPSTSKPALFSDVSDALPSLDPEGDKRREDARQAAAREQRLRDLTPAYIPIMRWGGLGVAAVGSIAAFVSTQEFHKDAMTQSEYSSVRLKNDLSWIAIGVGAASFVTSYIIAPSLPKEPKQGNGAPRSVAITLGPTNVRLGMSF